MKIFRDIIRSSTPVDRAVESDKPFDTNLIQGLWAFVDALKKSCDDLPSNAAVDSGVRRFGHGHNYGADELDERFAKAGNFAVSNQLLGRHINKRAVVCDQVEDTDSTIVHPVAVIPGERMSNSFAEVVLNGLLLEFLVGPGTVAVDVEIGVKSSGDSFEALFKPQSYGTAQAPVYSDDDAGWVTVNPASATSLTWISVLHTCAPYKLEALRPAAAAKNNSGCCDLNIWAIRITEVGNHGLYSTGDIEGFFTDIHQADLHIIDGKNKPGVKSE